MKLAPRSTRPGSGNRALALLSNPFNPLATPLCKYSRAHHRGVESSLHTDASKGCGGGKGGGDVNANIGKASGAAVVGFKRGGWLCSYLETKWIGLEIQISICSPPFDHPSVLEHRRGEYARLLSRQSFFVSPSM